MLHVNLNMYKRPKEKVDWFHAGVRNSPWLIGPIHSSNSHFYIEPARMNRVILNIAQEVNIYSKYRRHTAALQNTNNIQYVDVYEFDKKRAESIRSRYSLNNRPKQNKELQILFLFTIFYDAWHSKTG